MAIATVIGVGFIVTALPMIFDEPEEELVKLNYHKPDVGKPGLQEKVADTFAAANTDRIRVDYHKRALRGVNGNAEFIRDSCGTVNQKIIKI